MAFDLELHNKTCKPTTDGRCDGAFDVVSPQPDREASMMYATPGDTGIDHGPIPETVIFPQTGKEAFKPAFAAAPESDKGHARKMDSGKPPVAQGFMHYFPRAITAVAYVSEYGARKYARAGKDAYGAQWQEVENGEGRYGDADTRHRLKQAIEGSYDNESDLAHLAHKAWNAMAELEIALKTGRVEMRVGNEVKDGVPQLGTFKVVAL